MAGTANGQMVVINRAVLESYGCALDGETDDKNAFSAAITAQVGAGATSIVIEFPFCTMALSGPPADTGTVNVALRGLGDRSSIMKMLSGGSGIWTHGTSTAPATGFFSLQDIGFVDANAAGSGSTAISIYGASNAPDGCVRISNCRFDNFSAEFSFTNIRRGLQLRSLYLIGPSNSITQQSAITITATQDFTVGCFSYDFSEVLVSNHSQGWLYDIGSTLEGQVFNSCRAYNGFGMVKVTNSVANYQSLLWAFYTCDWQGLDGALDMEGCRGIECNGGYWIANLNSNNLALPSGRSTRRYFNFSDCSDVQFSNLKVDVLPNTESTLSLIYCDATCYNVWAAGTTIRNYSSINAAFEWEANGNSNVLGEEDTRLDVWNGGTVLLDHGNNQVQQFWVRSQYLGDVGRDGRYTVDATAGSTTTDDQGNLPPIQMPFRTSGAPLFLSSNVHVYLQALNSNAAMPALTLKAVSPSSLSAQLTNVTSPITLGLNMKLSGQ